MKYNYTANESDIYSDYITNKKYNLPVLKPVIITIVKFRSVLNIVIKFSTKFFFVILKCT